MTGVTLPTLATVMTFGCVATELNSATWNVVAETSGVVTISSASLVSTLVISTVTSSYEYEEVVSGLMVVWAMVVISICRKQNIYCLLYTSDAADD